MPFPVHGDYALPFPSQNAPDAYGAPRYPIPVRPQQEPWLDPRPDPWPGEPLPPEEGQMPQLPDYRNAGTFPVPGETLPPLPPDRARKEWPATPIPSWGYPEYYNQQRGPKGPIWTPPQPFPQGDLDSPRGLPPSEYVEGYFPHDKWDIANKYPLGPIPGKPNLLTDYNSLGNTRPFGPGEFVTNPDGTVSSERTFTVPVGNQWWVVPGMWLVNGTPTQVDPQTAAQYAQSSGLNWPTFDSENWANQYANHREAVLNRPGYGTGALEPLWSRPWPPR